MNVPFTEDAHDEFTDGVYESPYMIDDTDEELVGVEEDDALLTDDVEDEYGEIDNDNDDLGFPSEDDEEF